MCSLAGGGERWVLPGRGWGLDSAPSPPALCLHTSPDWCCRSRAFVLWGHLGDLGPKSRPSITSMASDPRSLHTFKQHLCEAGPGLAPCLTSTSSSQRMAEAHLPALGSLPWRGQGPAQGPEFRDRQSQEGNPHLGPSLPCLPASSKTGLRVPPGNCPRRELQVASWMYGILPAIADTSAALPSPTPPLGQIAFSNQQISYRAGSSCTQAWPSSCTEVGLCSLLLIWAGCHPRVSETRSQRMRWSLPVSLGTVPFERQPPCCEETKAAPRPSGASS